MATVTAVDVTDTTTDSAGNAAVAGSIATAGSADKCAAMTKLGADVAVNYREQDFVEAVKAATGGKLADVVLDMVGAEYFNRNLKCLAMDGRLVIIAFLGGFEAVSYTHLTLPTIYSV